MPKSRNKRKKTRQPKAMRSAKSSKHAEPQTLGMNLLAAVFTGIAGAVFGGLLIALLIVLAGVYYGDIATHMRAQQWLIWRGAAFLGGVGFLSSIDTHLVMDRLALAWQRRKRRDD